MIRTPSQRVFLEQRLEEVCQLLRNLGRQSASAAQWRELNRERMLLADMLASRFRSTLPRQEAG